MGGLSSELKSFVSTPRKMVCYNGQGRKKNERWFSLSHLERLPAEVTWRRKATANKGKSMPLRDVHDGGALRVEEAMSTLVVGCTVSRSAS